MEEGFGLRMRRRRVWKSIQACFCIFTKYIGWEAGAERERERDEDKPVLASTESG